MRILLINPYYPISETPSPPLGLAYLAGSLERAGIEVKLLDLVVFPYEKKRLGSVIQEFSPHFAGVTAVTMTYENAIEVIKDVKQCNPEIMTVIGGPHVTFFAEETLNSVQEIDFIVLGEGEETIVDLLTESEKGKQWEKVKGIVFREGSRIYDTGPREVLDVDSLPFPSRHLIHLGRYRALGMPISIITSRGCPFNCIFCVGRKMSGRKVRYRNPLSVVDEIEQLCSFKFHQINIADDLFTANREHCVSICEEIVSRQINIKWSAFSRVDTINIDILRKMKNAGCCAISFGVESGNEDILKSIKKGITLEQVISAVKICIEIGITPHLSFILGLPGETPETLKDTVEFGNELKHMGALHGFHLLAPFPGSDIYENMEKYDIKILSTNWKDYHANRAIAETSSVKKDVLDGIVIEWEDKFNEYLGDIKIRMTKGIAGDYEVSLLSNLESTVLIYDLMMTREIEEKGHWKNNGTPDTKENHLKILVGKLNGHNNFNKEQIYQILNNSIEKGNLICEKNSGETKWQWINNI
jgi:radical SAM superfamily enzyme YgiQ (UPF0313 family)